MLLTVLNDLLPFIITALNSSVDLLIISPKFRGMFSLDPLENALPIAILLPPLPSVTTDRT